MKQKIFYDPSTGFSAKANSKTGAWVLIRNKCVELGHHPPTLDQVYQAITPWLWEKFVQILQNDGLTNVDASVIYGQAYADYPDFEEWAVNDLKCTAAQARQLYKECELTREEL